MKKSFTSRYQLLVVAFAALAAAPACAEEASSQPTATQKVIESKPAAIAVETITPAVAVQPVVESKVVEVVAEDVLSQGLEFDYKEIDMGTMNEGEKLNIEFPFINKSDKTITIESIKASCGCTAPALDKKVFAPGEGDTIRALFNSARRKGRNTKTLTVTTDDTDTPQYRLQFTVQIKTEIEFSNPAVNMGKIKEGTSHTEVVNLISYTEEPITITSARASMNSLIVEVGEPVPYKPEDGSREGTAYPISVTVPAEQRAGNLNSNLVVTTSHNNTTFTCALRGQVVGDLTSSPSSLNFGILPPNQTTFRRMNLATLDGAKFEFKSIHLSYENQPNAPEKNELQISGEIMEDAPGNRPNSQTLNISMTAPESFGRYSGTATISGLLGGEEYNLDTPFSLYVRAAKDNNTSNNASIDRNMTTEERQKRIKEMQERILEKSRQNQEAPAE